ARWDNRVETYLIEHAPPPPEPVDEELERVRRLVVQHGWQACLAVLDIPNVPSEEILLYALKSNRALCRALFAHYGSNGVAGAGAA
ncbi:MAG TPA: hypothetical protein VEA38_06665, partial [Terriglobales bacterium]|nr:hypothetical protein [Terriglobales bacterium]